MKSILILFLATLSSLNLTAQWYQVNSNTIENLNDVFFVNSQTGYAIGGSYTNPGDVVVIKTTDGGENWTSVFAQTDLALREVVAFGSTVKCFGNNNGTPIVIVSTDNGANWQINTLAPLNGKIYPTVHQNDLYFLGMGNSGQGFDLKKEDSDGNEEILASDARLYGIHQNYVVYINSAWSTVYKSDDLGQNWISLPDFPSDLNGNHSLNSKVKAFNNTIVVWASYPTKLHHSLNNGVSWTSIIQQGIPGSPAIIAINENNTIYGIGYHPSNGNFISVTDNLGQTWTIQKNNITESLSGIYFYDINLGFVIGENGAIYKTVNGGGLNVSSPKSEKKIKVYPNPADNTLNIEHNNNLIIQKTCLTDMQGGLVREYPENLKELDVSNVASGNYLLQVYTNQGKFTKKVVIN